LEKELQKIKDKIKDSFPIAELLDEISLARLNSLFGTHYCRGWAKKNIRVERASKGFRFLDRLMRGKPGFEKKGKDHEE
jgi:hypothetical protein